MVICTYPGLIAAYHVLHRLHEPRHPPCALYYFLYDIKSHSRNLMVTLTSLWARSNYEPEPLILSAVLIVKYSSSSLKALRSTSLKLNLSLTFYSLSCVNMSKISWTHSSEGRFRNRTEITTVSPNLYLNKQFRVQEALGSTEPDFLISFCSD